MPQSLNLTVLHLVFSTKDRFPFLSSDILAELHPYLATITRQGDGECYRVGGVADHVHLAVRLPRTVSIADLVNELKSSSTRWLKTRFPTLSKFAWQRGYGVFSVGPKDLDAVTAYIDRQEEHHQTRTFQDEYRAFLRQYGIAFDERYVWD